MNKEFLLALFILLLVGITILVAFLLGDGTIAVLNPKGIVATQERDLIIFALLLSLVVVIPVFVLTFVFAWKFREGRGEKYEPDWNHNSLLEIAWWAIPATVIFVLAVVTWKGTHALDPYKPIEATAKPIAIQVVALQWKWLFIYPEQKIATVNFIEFPVHTPVSFELTADAPMNSFWIPQLSGQIYAMPGHATQLNLMADETGEFAGSAAEISGRGFAGMKFTAKASSIADFDAWVQSVKGFGNTLGSAEYNKLAEPSENNPVVFYASVEENLFDKIIMKFMVPASPASKTSNGNMRMQDNQYQ